MNIFKELLLEYLQPYFEPLYHPKKRYSGKQSNTVSKLFESGKIFHQKARFVAKEPKKT
jgi:hypothetical protein